MKRGQTVYLNERIIGEEVQHGSFPAELISMVSDHGNFQSWIVQVKDEKKQRVVLIRGSVSKYRNKNGIDFNELKRGMFINFNNIICVIESKENEILHITQIEALKAVESNGRKIIRLKNSFHIAAGSDDFHKLKVALLSKFSYELKK